MPPVEIPSWLKPHYPFSPRSFTTPRGARMSYLDEGQGSEAVLMLHGNPTWSFYYRELVQAVAPSDRAAVENSASVVLVIMPPGRRAPAEWEVY